MSGRYRKEAALLRAPELELHLARDLTTEAEVLLVFVPDRSKDAFMRFQNRVRAWERLDHPGLARVLDSGELGGGTLFYALDAAAAVTLAPVLEQGLGTAEERSAWAESLEGALAALHEAGLAHGRLSAEACLLLPDGRALLALPHPFGGKATPEVDLEAFGALRERLEAAAGASPLDPDHFALLRNELLDGPPKELRPPPRRLPRAPTRPPPGHYRLPLPALVGLAAVGLAILAAVLWILTS